MGRENSVDVIVDGSVHRVGDNLRVSPRLLNVADGFQLLARRFDKPSKEIFALSDEIATAVADALTTARDLPERGPPTDQMAVELYLRARFEARKLFTGGIEHALSLFEEALRRAPEDPTILAGYASAQMRRWFFGNQDAFAKPRDAAENAVARAPHLYDARNALALLKLHGADYAGAILELKGILARQSFVASHESYASILHEIGLIEEAKRHIEMAMKIDPSSAFAAFELSRIHALAGEWGEASAIIDRMVVTETSAVGAEVSAAGLRYLLWQRNIDGARERLNSRTTENVGPLTKHLLSLTLNGQLERGEVSTASRAAASVGSFRRRTLLHQLEAETAGIARDVDWFVEALQLADESQLIDIVWLDKCPLFTEFHSDPRVRAIAERIRYRANSLVEIVRYKST